MTPSVLSQLVNFMKKIQIAHLFKEKIYSLMKDANTYKEELVTSVTSFYKSYMLIIKLI